MAVRDLGRAVVSILRVAAVAIIVGAILGLVMKKDVGYVWKTYLGWLIMIPALMGALYLGFTPEEAGAICIIGGADGPTAIAKWAQLNEAWLKKHLTLPHGTPRKDTFRRVLSSLNPIVFQQCFAEWIESLRTTSGDDSGGDAMRHVAGVGGTTTGVGRGGAAAVGGA